MSSAHLPQRSVASVSSAAERQSRRSRLFRCCGVRRHRRLCFRDRRSPARSQQMAPLHNREEC